MGGKGGGAETQREKNCREIINPANRHHIDCTSKKEEAADVDVDVVTSTNKHQPTSAWEQGLPSDKHGAGSTQLSFFGPSSMYIEYDTSCLPVTRECTRGMSMSMSMSRDGREREFIIQPLGSALNVFHHTSHITRHISYKEKKSVFSFLFLSGSVWQL